MPWKCPGATLLSGRAEDGVLGPGADTLGCALQLAALAVPAPGDRTGELHILLTALWERCSCNYLISCFSSCFSCSSPLIEELVG